MWFAYEWWKSIKEPKRKQDTSDQELFKKYLREAKFNIRM